MRYPTSRVEAVRSKVITMTGGIKENISQLEAKPGTLISSQNYEEIDGQFHGYSSIKGYERYDGTPLASSVDIYYLLDYGIDTSTSFLLESDSQSPILDISNYAQTVVNNGVINDTLNKKFLSSSFYFLTASNFTVTPVDNGLDLTYGTRGVDGFRENFTIDFLLRDGVFGTATQHLFEKGISYKVYVDINSKLVFEYSVDGVSWEVIKLTSDTTLTSAETHVAIFRKADTVYMAFDGFIDGNTLDIGTDDIFPVADDLVIASDYEGSMDEIRVSTKYRWLTEFAIPTKAYSTAGYYTYSIDDEDREAARTTIMPVPGNGPILGIANREGFIGAVRNNLTDTNSLMYRGDPTGWSDPIPGAMILYFENGIDTAAEYPGPLAGQYVRGSVSGATAKIVDITTISGSWINTAQGRDAYGVMTLNNIVLGGGSADFTDTDLLTVESPLGTPLTSTADIVDGSYVEFLLEPDGSYEFINARFAELIDNQRELVPFFTNGVNFPVYYDGAELVPILSTYLPDSQGVYATHVTAFKNRLWLAYPDGRLWYSEVNNPLGWDTALGAGEIYMEDEITGMEVAPGDALVIFGRDSLQIIKSIYDSDLSGGNTAANYAFYKESFSKRSGAYSKSIQRLLGEIYFLDDRGLTTLSAVDTYGDFGHSSVSKNVQKTIAAKRNLITATTVQRASNQYRLFFSDNTGLYFTFDLEKKIKGVTEVKFENKVRVITEGETASGDILIAFGSEEDELGDAYVYLMDSGTSFDGNIIETKLSTAFYAYGSATNWKRFHKATIETQSEKGLIFKGRPDFNYRNQNVPRSIEESYVSTGLGGVWGQDAWGFFTYGSGEVVTPILYLSGYGNNMSMNISTEDKHRSPHVINSLIVEYSIVGKLM
jgi:hypothetical protein